MYCDVDTQDVVPKLIHDFAGHYNRPDIFWVVAADGADCPPRFAGWKRDVGRDYAPRTIVNDRSPYYLEAPKVTGGPGDRDT